jgi:hypothetical protein
LGFEAAMKVIIKIVDGKAVPAAPETEEFFKKSEGRFFSTDLKIARSPGLHNYVMKMIRIMLDMVDANYAFDPFRKMLTIKAGFFTSIGKVNVNGETSVAVIPDSLAFENMDEEEFRECWLTIHQAFVEKYGKTLTDEQLNEWSRM